MPGIHSRQLCAPSDVGLRELESGGGGGMWGGVGWERLVSLPSLPMADSWVVWTYVNTAPHSSLRPPPCCSEKSSGVTASRCGLQMWLGAGQADQGCRGSHQAPGFSFSLLL